jgi:hypothetical protein
MQFTPKSEEEIKKGQEQRQAKNAPWPKGNYDFVVISEANLYDKIFQTCDAKTRKTNADMIILVVKIMNEHGEIRILVDYLVEAAEEKFRNAAVTCGLLEEYNKGQLYASDFLGKSGKLVLGIKKGEPKPDGSGNYPDKNEITGYAPENGSKAALNDEIPF